MHNTSQYGACDFKKLLGNKELSCIIFIFINYMYVKRKCAKKNMNYFFAMDVNKNCLNVNMYFLLNLCAVL